jgi:hypothetical protein
LDHRTVVGILCAFVVESDRRRHFDGFSTSNGKEDLTEQVLMKTNPILIDWMRDGWSQERLLVRLVVEEAMVFAQACRRDERYIYAKNQVNQIYNAPPGSIPVVVS